MSISLYLFSSIILVLVYIIIPKLFKRSNTKLPPSPPKLPFIGNLHELGNLPHQSLFRLSNKYGPVMHLKLGTIPTVVVSTPETARQALKVFDLNCCSRPPLAGSRQLSYNYRDIAFSPFNEYWKEVRKLVALQLFNNRQVNSIQPIKDEEIKNLMDSIAQSASQNNPVNLSDKFLSFTANVVCKASFGVAFQGTVLNNDSFDNLVRDALGILGSFSASNFFPYVGWFMDWFTGLHGRREKTVRDLDAFYEQMIGSDRKEKKEGTEDFVDVLLRLAKEGAVLGNEKLTRNHIKAILMNVLLAGIDTSAISMTWTMAELAKNPRVMKKVQEEIRNQFKNKGRVTVDGIDQLHYLRMVIKETWRLHPIVPLLLPRDVMSEFQINGYTIPAKTRLHVNVWAIGRDPDTWKDPEMFFPERFMDANIDAKGQHFELLAFGSGRRICPGMYMGTTMVESCLANLLYHFDWKLPKGMAVEDVDMEECPGLTVTKKNELLLVPVKHLDH
uniref:Cytochrome P450 71B34-2 n=1 Tax=Isatis tinctoria TaxID=161756 RepID=A0A8F0FTZ3_ISATI|nr:cytochrome P450 71B34-2 [Isatis tinctoria]